MYVYSPTPKNVHLKWVQRWRLIVLETMDIWITVIWSRKNGWRRFGLGWEDTKHRIGLGWEDTDPRIGLGWDGEDERRSNISTIVWLICFLRLCFSRNLSFFDARLNLRIVNSKVSRDEFTLCNDTNKPLKLNYTLKYKINIIIVLIVRFLIVIWSGTPCTRKKMIKSLIVNKCIY